MDRFDISLNQWKGIRKVKSITKTVHFILYNNFVCSWSDVGFTYDCCQPIHIGYMGYCDGTAPFVLAMWTVVCILSKLSGVGFVCFSWWLLCVCCVGVWKDLPWSSCSALDPARATTRPSSWLTRREVRRKSDVNLAVYPVVYRPLKCYLLQFQEYSVTRKMSFSGSSLTRAWPLSKHCLIHNRHLFVLSFLHRCAKLAGKNRLFKRAAVHLRIFPVEDFVRCIVETEGVHSR